MQIEITAFVKGYTYGGDKKNKIQKKTVNNDPEIDQSPCFVTFYQSIIVENMT